jgi:outer membrane lipoprotein-sorting protein
MPGYRFIVLLCFLSALITAGQEVLAKSTLESADASGSSILPDGKSGTALIDQLMKHVSNLGDYKYEASQEAYQGSKVVKATGTFYFKPANSVRMEVKDYGCKSGSILMKSPDGKIMGKGGPQMWGMKMTLQQDSRLLKMPNGMSVLESDLASLMKKLKQEAAAGNKIVSGAQPIKVDGLGAPVIVIESQLNGESSAPVVERVFIDPSQNLPLQWDSFEKGTFRSRSRFQNYQVNAHWDDSRFTM